MFCGAAMSDGPYRMERAMISITKSDELFYQSAGQFENVVLEYVQDKETAHRMLKAIADLIMEIGSKK